MPALNETMIYLILFKKCTVFMLNEVLGGLNYCNFRLLYHSDLSAF